MCWKCENKDNNKLAAKIWRNDNNTIGLYLAIYKDDKNILAEVSYYDNNYKDHHLIGKLPISYCPYCGKKLD